MQLIAVEHENFDHLVKANPCFSDFREEVSKVFESKQPVAFVKACDDEILYHRLYPVVYKDKVSDIIYTQYDFGALKELICDDGNELMLANLSHELRSPLVSILGYSNVLLTDNTPEDKQFAAEVINKSCTKQLDMLESLIDFSRLNARGATLNKTVFLFREIVEELREEYLLKIQQKGIEFIIHNGHKNLVEADKTRLYQVFNNLLSNSLKFTENGKIEVDIHYSGNQLVVEIRDTGVGIEDTSDIFKPFSQVENREKGLGLGLHVVKRIVDLHGGTVTVNSSLKGTNFKVVLPIGSVQKKILILEDDKVTIDILKEALSSYNLATVGNCDAFTKRIEVEKFDLIICDLYLPDGCSLDQISKVDRNIPVIALTSAVGMKDKALQAGFNVFLTKPVNIGKLKREVLRLLDKS